MNAAPTPAAPRTHAEEFICHLTNLKATDPGALATLRHSLGFAPGTYVPAFRYVERFVPPESRASAPYRLALYLVAALFARNPKHSAGQRFATAFAQLSLRRRKQRGSNNIEQRFITLLSSNHETLPNYLQQGMSLLASDEIPCDYAALLNDASIWLNPSEHDRLDTVRQHWARDFYRTLTPASSTEHAPQTTD